MLSKDHLFKKSTKDVKVISYVWKRSNSSGQQGRMKWEIVEYTQTEWRTYVGGLRRPGWWWSNVWRYASCGTVVRTSTQQCCRRLTRWTVERRCRSTSPTCPLCTCTNPRGTRSQNVSLTTRPGPVRWPSSALSRRWRTSRRGLPSTWAATKGDANDSRQRQR